MSYLTQEEKQQLSFDWRYRGFSTIQLLTEEEADEINDELEKLRKQRQETTKEDGSQWGNWDPFAYPHKLSEKLTKLFSHPKIIEACEYASDAYWGNPDRFMFRAFIDSFSTATELTAGKDRLVKGTFNIRLRGYILPDTIQRELNATKVYNSKAKVTINTETVGDIDKLDDSIQNPTDNGRKRNLRELQ